MNMFSYIGGGGYKPPFCAVCKSPCSFNRCYNPECSQYVNPIDEFNNTIVIHKNQTSVKNLTRKDAKHLVQYSTMEAAEVFEIIDKIFDSFEGQLQNSYRYNDFWADSNTRQKFRDGGWSERKQI